MPEVHAKLGASSAKRWMSCPPSVKLEEQFQEEVSEYAAEGTLAHALAELILRYNNHEMTKKTFSTRSNKLKADPLYNAEMEDYLLEYTHAVWELINEAKKDCPDALALFEQRLDFSDFVPDGFGTGDVVIVADEFVHVIDLKYGKGIGVSAEKNPQLRLYGLGAYMEHSMLYDIKRIKMTIIQPRLENISTEELTIEELLDWAENEVKPKATLADAGEGDFLAGDHCRFCKARKICKARADYNLELAKFEFVDADLLSDEEIGKVLIKANELTAWVKDIQEYAFDQVINQGKNYEGWKLVEGKSNRKYSDEKLVVEKLLQEDYKENQIYKPRQILGITEMEKLLGKKKFMEFLQDKIVKPEGKPVLVRADDKRLEINSVQSAQKDFDN